MAITTGTAGYLICGFSSSRSCSSCSSFTLEWIKSHNSLSSSCISIIHPYLCLWLYNTSHKNGRIVYCHPNEVGLEGQWKWQYNSSRSRSKEVSDVSMCAPAMCHERTCPMLLLVQQECRNISSSPESKLQLEPSSQLLGNLNKFLCLDQPNYSQLDHKNQTKPNHVCCYKLLRFVFVCLFVSQKCNLLEVATL